MYSRTLRGFIGVAVVLWLGASAFAQEGAPPRKSVSAMLNVDALIDNYLRVVARKYDLSDDQRAFTETLVRQKVDDFLNRRQGELGELVDRLFEVRSGGQMSTDELMQWGKRVLPLYNDAKAIIVDASVEWRQTLNDQQQAILDDDIRLMNDSFTSTEDQLQRIITGQMTVDEFRSPKRMRPAQPQSTAQSVQPPPAVPQTAAPPVAPAPANPAPVAGQPEGEAPRVTTPTAGETSPTPTPGARPGSPKAAAGKSDAGPAAPGGRTPARGTAEGRDAKPTGPGGERVARGPGAVGAGAAAGDAEGKWDAYVRQFVERYKLNDDQKARAYKILASCQVQARRYMETRQAEADRLDRRAAELKGTKDTDLAKELTEIAAARNKLMEPISQIFERQLKPRLEKLPTRAQRDAAETQPKKDQKDVKKPGGG